MLKHQTRLRQKSSNRENPQQTHSPPPFQSEESNMFKQDAYSPDQRSQMLNNQSSEKRRGSPVMYPSSIKKTNLASSDPSSVIFKHESSAASTSIISKYFNDVSPSAGPTNHIQQDPNNSKRHFTQMNTAAVIMSDSDSSIYSLVEKQQQLRSQQKSQQNSKQTFHSKSNSQASRNSKSRNTHTNSLTQNEISQAAAENAIIQEGIKVLFSKSNKKKNSAVSPSPFRTLGTANGKPPTKTGEKDKPSLVKKNTGKSKKPQKKVKSKSATRSKTMNEKHQSIDEKNRESDPMNIIFPNLRHVEQLHQRRSLDLDNQSLSISSSKQNNEDYQQQVNTANFQFAYSNRSNNKTILTQSEYNNKVIKQGRAIQMLVSQYKHFSKDQKRRYFEKWKFISLANRSSVQILAQTRWINEIQSIRSESEQELLMKNREMIIRKGVACIFRYKSRRLASMFHSWKYKAQFINYMNNYLNYKKANYGDNNDYSQRSSINNRQNNNMFNNNNPHDNPYIEQRNNRIQKIRTSVNEQYSDEFNENIDESEDSAEKVISKQKKLGLMQNKTVGRQHSSKEYNFNNPTAELEQLPYQLEIFKQILQSPNKDFGRLMMQQSECSIQYFNDNIVNDATSSRRVSLDNRRDLNQLNITANLTNQFQQKLGEVKAFMIIKQKLQGQLREVFRNWRTNTERYLLNAEFKLQLREINVKKQIAKKLGSLRVINSNSILRHEQLAFNQWKLFTVIEKKAENRKLQQYFLNNAKVEVQRSKAVLQKLYQQKHMFDEEQKVFRSRSTSPDGTVTFQSTMNPAMVSGGSNNYRSFAGLSPQLNQNITFAPQQIQQQRPQPPQGFSSSSIMQLMNPYFTRNQHALPQRLQQIVNQKNNQQEVTSQIKSLCYDMLLDILEEAEKNQRPPNAN